MDTENGRDFIVGDIGLALTGVCLGLITFFIGFAKTDFINTVIIKGKKNV